MLAHLLRLFCVYVIVSLLTMLIQLRPGTAQEKANAKPTAKEVLQGLRRFYQKTARPDGCFAPGTDAAYKGMSDCAYSDLAAVTYACTVHRTFGWKLPHEKKTIAFLRSRQKKSGEFFNVAGTVDPKTAEAKTYNTAQALVALHALGAKPRYNPLPVFEDILKKVDLRSLPPYMSSFFPLAYRCYGRAIPDKLDEAIRATMIQDDDGYLNNHIAATFHASHYYRLIGRPTPKAHEMVARILREQKPDGSWLLNRPSRDRHATFDAVFTLHQEGHGRTDCRQAIARAARWALSCRNADGGFGHFPGSTSDADAVYFHVGTLVMAGFFKPAQPLPRDPHLLSWGHMMPVKETRSGPERLAFHLPGWIGAVAFSSDGRLLAAASADRKAYIWNVKKKKKTKAFAGHKDYVVSVQFSPDNSQLATGSYDHTARIWDVASGKTLHTLSGHRGVVMSVAYSPDGKLLATGSIDRTIKLWNSATGKLVATLKGHRSWVNSVAFAPDGKTLISGSSDGTVKIWDIGARKLKRSIAVSKAEVRSVAISPNGQWIAAGIRYGQIKVWQAGTGKEKLNFRGHKGDVWSIAFLPGGKLLSGDGDWNQPGIVKLWDIATGRLTRQFQHTGEVLAVAAAPRGNLIAAGGADNMVRVWDLSR